MGVVTGGGGGSTFNGGTITQRLEIDAPSDSAGLLGVHATDHVAGFYGLKVTDDGNHVLLATQRSAGGLSVLALADVDGGITVWSSDDNDGTPGLAVDSAHNVSVGAAPIDGGKVGFYGKNPVVQQTGVAVTIAAVHAALVNLGLFTA